MNALKSIDLEADRQIKAYESAVMQQRNAKFDSAAYVTAAYEARCAFGALIAFRHVLTRIIVDPKAMKLDDKISKALRDISESSEAA